MEGVRHQRNSRERETAFEEIVRRLWRWAWGRLMAVRMLGRGNCL